MKLVIIQAKAAAGIIKECKGLGEEIGCSDKFLVQVIKVPDDFYYTLIEKEPKYQATALANMVIFNVILKVKSECCQPF